MQKSCTRGGHPAIPRDIANRFFHFSYLRLPPKQEPRLHELRDGNAFAELATVLTARGLAYGGLLLNYPETDDAELATLDRSDVVVLTTRPPLDDDDGWERNPIPKTGSSLERVVLAGAGRYFAKCRRSCIRLNRDTAAHLGPAADRAEIHFYIYKRSHYRRYRNPYGVGAGRQFGTSPAANTTAAFLVSVPLTPGGPRLLNAFGMDGATTLVWCYLLRTRFAHLLDGPRFVLAEIETTALPHRPSRLDFADEWPVRLLLDLPLTQAPA